MRLITLLGQTASGKTQLSLDLYDYLTSKGYKSWLVSCDSRQVYKGMKLGTNKPNGLWLPSGIQSDGKDLQTLSFPINPQKAYFINGAPHFLIDYIDPREEYGLADYLSHFQCLRQTLASQSPPNQPDFIILVGGTGLYARAVNQGYALEKVKSEFVAQWNKTREELARLEVNQLRLELAKFRFDWQKLNKSEQNNPRRLQNHLLRAIGAKNHWFDIELSRKPAGEELFKSKIKFAIRSDNSVVPDKIAFRLRQRLDLGLIQELENTFLELGAARARGFGLEYRVFGDYLSGKIAFEQLPEAFLQEEFRYAKKQLTWLKKEPDLNWIGTELKQLIDLLGL